MKEEPSLIDTVLELQRQLLELKRAPPAREPEYEDYGYKRGQRPTARCEECQVAVKTHLQSYDKVKATGNLKERCSFVGFAGDKKQRFSITPCNTCLEKATRKVQDWTRAQIRALKE